MRKKERDKIIANPKAFVEVWYRDKYKTAVYLPETPHLFRIITRVNYLTAQLWLEWRNKQVNDGRKGFVILPDKPNWLVMNRYFRRRQERLMKVLPYLKERSKRKHYKK